MIVIEQAVFDSTICQCLEPEDLNATEHHS